MSMRSLLHGLVPRSGQRLVHSLVRREAPQFSLKALVKGEFKQIKSEEFRGKYWVLFFYPLDLYLLFDIG